MLVPEKDAQPPGTDESTLTPGAATSGLRRSETVVGPTDENEACVGRFGVSSVSTAPTLIASAADDGEDTDPAPTSL